MTDALITNIINNLFHVIWFYSLVLEPRYGKKKTFLITVMTGVLFQVGITALFASDIMSHYTYLKAYLLTVVVFEGVFVCVLSVSHPAKSAFLISAYYCLWIFIYGVISLFTMSWAGAGNPGIWGLRVFLNLLFLSLYLGFFKKRLIRIYRQMQSGYELIAVISGMMFVMMTFLLFYNEYKQERDAGHIFMMALSYGFLLIVYVLLFYFMAQANHVQELKQVRLHEKCLMEQLSTYEKIEQNARQTRHDFRHHNIVVMELAEKRDYEGILQYLKEYERIEAEKQERSYCRNHALNSLLSAYAKKAGQEGIDISVEVHLEDTLCISEVDAVSVLANMMENAVHGCMEMEGKREIEVRVKQANQILLMLCKNSCAADILFCNGLPQSHDHEGVGVKSIENTVAKYAGDVDFSARDGVFICRVLLNGNDGFGKE